MTSLPDNSIDILYLHVIMKIKPGKLEEFQESVDKYLEEFYDVFGWTLINAAYKVTGEIDQVVHTWSLPDGIGANAVQEVMVHAQQSDSYKYIQTLIETTTQEITSAMEYDPLMFGYQSETLVLDCNSAGWMLDNKTLKEEDADSVKASRWMDCENEITFLAGQGALSARLATEDSQGHRNLLFNLAQIQPKSCYQWPPKNNRDLKAIRDKANPEPKYPANVDKIFLLTPWGKRYSFTRQELQETSMRYITPDEIKDDKRLSLLLKSQVTLATIPEQRHSVVPGTGSMCYIINLASFDFEPN